MIDESEADIGHIDKLRTMGLFETSCKMLKGLESAFMHYERGEEKAWRR